MENERLDIRLISPLVLAYLGDGILEVYVREHLVRSGKVKIDDLHKSAIAYVSAKAQSSFYDLIEKSLNEEEQDVLKRGRNAKKNVPKNNDVLVYRKSTGIEALIGYLYLKKRAARLEEIIEQLYQMVEEV